MVKNTSAPSPVSLFNKQFIAFLDDILRVFPEDKDIINLHKLVVSVQKKNVKLASTMWRNCVVKYYKNAIMRGDLNYFIDKKYDDDMVGAGVASNSMLDLNSIIDRLRGPISMMSASNKHSTIMHMRGLTVISEAISPIGGDARPRTPSVRPRLAPNIGWHAFDSLLARHFGGKTSVECGGFPDCFYFSVLHQLRQCGFVEDCADRLADVAALRNCVADHLASLPSDQITPLELELSLTSGFKSQLDLFMRHNIVLVPPKAVVTSVAEAPESDRDDDAHNAKNKRPRIGTEVGKHISNLTISDYVDLVKDGLFGGDIEIGVVCKLFDARISIACEHMSVITVHKHGSDQAAHNIELCFHLSHYRSLAMAPVHSNI